MSGRHGRVSREHAMGGHGLECGVEGKPLCEVLSQQLQDKERGVAFVQMPDRRHDTQRAQGACPANAENHLLPNAS